MLLAQCQAIGRRTLRESLGPPHRIELNATLAQAVHMMVQYRLVNIPVTEHKRLVGILREKDLIASVAEMVGGAL